MGPIIRTEALTHIYSQGTPFERTAVKNICFEAERGEFIGIIGHTGSGKSTFIQHLNGLLKPTAGRVLLDGEDIFENKHKTRQARFRVGLVFQYPEYQLFEETVYKDIAFGPKNMGLSEAEIDERVREAADFAGVGEELLQSSPFELSGGQKRKTAIAGVIAMRPEVLILDEPTAGLDPYSRDSVLENICRYHKEKNNTVILVTHSMEIAASLSDRLIVFNHGEIEMTGAPGEVYKHSARLQEIGLAIPASTRVVLRLKELGIDVDTDVYTVEQAKQAILRAKEAL